MTALQEAKAIHNKLGLNFEQVLCYYLTNGYVLSLPDRFIMAKKIVEAEGDDCWNPEKPDCWYVHCAVGKNAMPWFFNQMDEHLPKVAFQRVGDSPNRLRVYNTDRLIRLLQK